MLWKSGLTLGTRKSLCSQGSKISHLASTPPPPAPGSLPSFLFLCPQFADQENQVAHLELGQVECQLKTTLEALRERSLQCEDLKDTVENLK